MNNDLRIQLAAIFAAGGIFSTILYRSGWEFGNYLAIGSFLALIVLQAGRFTRLAHIVLTIAILAVSVTLATDHLALADLAAAAFIFAFTLSSGLLRQVAGKNPALRNLGEQLVAMRSARRYPVVSLAVALQSLPLLMGALQFFAGMVEARSRGNQQARIATLLAGLAGFTLNPVLSPLAIPFIVISSIVPQMVWIDLLPALLSVAFAVWVAGYLQDRFFFAGRGHSPAGGEESQPGFKFDPAVLLPILSPIAVAIAISIATPFSLAESALIACAAVAIVWTIREWDAVAGDFASGLIASRNEAAVIGGSVATGLALLSLLPDGMLGGFGAALSAYSVFLPAAIIAAFVLLGQVGLQPAVCFLLLLPLIGEILDNETIRTVPVLAATIAGWGLNSVTSPVGVPVLVVSSAAGVTSSTLAWRYNILFALGASIGAGLLLGLQM